MKKDILFIHPANHARSYQELAHAFTAIAPPVWSALLAEALRRQGIDIALHDTNIDGWSTEIAAGLLQKHDPGCVVLMVYGNHPSASTQTMPAAGRIGRDLKTLAPDLPVLMGGGHPSALPERTLREEAADFVVRGEGLTTLTQFAAFLHGKKKLGDIAGLSRRASDGRVTHNADAAQVEDLDSAYPGYAWDLLPPLSRYRAHNSHTLQYFQESLRQDFADVRSPYAILYSSIGCPHRCTYCCAHQTFGGRGIRFWSPAKVVSFVDELVQQHGVRHIRFDDELFFSAPARVAAIFDLLAERNHDVNLWGYARVDSVSPPLLAKMKRGGMNWLCLGIESADRDILAGLNKKTENSKVRQVVRMIKDHGIYVLGNFMFGLPGDTVASMQATLDFAQELECEFVNFYCTMPYPGSELYDLWLAQKPSALPETWNGYSQHGYEAKPLPTGTIDAATVLAFRDEAFLASFSDDRYLNMIAQKFGPRAVEHIKEMTAIRLDRRLLQKNAAA